MRSTCLLWETKAEAWVLLSEDEEVVFTRMEEAVFLKGQVRDSKSDIVDKLPLPDYPKSSAAMIQNPITNPEKIRIATTSIIRCLLYFLFVVNCVGGVGSFVAV